MTCKDDGIMHTWLLVRNSGTVSVEAQASQALLGESVQTPLAIDAEAMAD